MHVAVRRHRFGRGQTRRCLRSGRLVEIGQDQSSSLRGQSLGDRPTDAVAGSGDHGDPADEPPAQSVLGLARSQHVAGHVGRRLGVLGGDLLHLGDKGGDLVLRGAGHGQRLGDQGVELGLGQAEPTIGREPVEQVVAGESTFPHGESDADGVLLDRLMGGLRPTPLRTAAIKTLVVVRNGR